LLCEIARDLHRLDRELEIVWIFQETRLDARRSLGAARIPEKKTVPARLADRAHDRNERKVDARQRYGRAGLKKHVGPVRSASGRRAKHGLQERMTSIRAGSPFRPEKIA